MVKYLRQATNEYLPPPSTFQMARLPAPWLSSAHPPVRHAVNAGGKPSGIPMRRRFCSGFSLMSRGTSHFLRRRLKQGTMHYTRRVTNKDVAPPRHVVGLGKKRTLDKMRARVCRKFCPVLKIPVYWRSLRSLGGHSACLDGLDY